MRPAVEVRLAGEDPRARYTMETFLTIAGYPFRFVDEWREPALRVTCGPGERGDDADLHVPSTRPTALWTVTLVENVPVVHDADATPPETLWSDGTARFDLVRFPFTLLSREEELGVEDDQFPSHRSVLYDLDLSRCPVLNVYANLLEEAIAGRLSDAGESLDRAPHWPDRRQFAVVLSHDVDVVSATGFGEAVRRVRTAVTGSDLSRRERFKSLLLASEQAAMTLRTADDPDPAWNFETWVDIESERDVRSTFFIAAVDDRKTQDPTYMLEDTLAYDGEFTTVAGLFRQLANDGWEVALHGSIGTHSDGDAFAAEHERLASALGSDVAGVRQHHLKFEYPSTWRHHETAGLQYDSTLGFNRRMGYRAGLAFPYRPYDCRQDRMLGIVELPITLQDNVPLLFEYAGRQRALERCRRAVDDVAATGGLVNLLWHPYTRHHPRWPEPISVYRDLLDYILGRDAFVGTAREVAAWWRMREAWLKGARDDRPTVDDLP